MSATVPSTAPPHAPSAAGRIRFQHPELPPMEEVLAYFERSREACWFSNGGPCASELTARLEARLGGDTTCVLVANATLGLMAALRAACGESGGLIVTPSYTFTATACAIRWAGFEPLFVDVDARNWQLHPAQLDRALAERGGEIAGVLACATFGTAPPPEVRSAWRELTAASGVPLVIDSAPGFGSLDLHGRPLGGLGDTEVFSFHATKPFAIGEGGMVATADPELAARIASLINFGLDETRISMDAGLNAKLSELHAATGLAALDRFDGVLAARRRVAGALRQATSRCGLTLQAGSGGSTWQFFQALAPDAAAREAVLDAARDLHVEARTLHAPPLHRHPAFVAAPRHGSLAVTDDLAARSLSLPLANDMTQAAVDRVAEAVRC
ncbi:MAG TPA: aminotransferase class I/II-fold pyridoxal phosphate-dependent enzyme [Solirubrobacteraceae bacterium]|jgi:dTDP-4-amino-4,6-dideoxygalactose transaminase|nr:aminotransferase class I/II-fold pyridoxal phosphate-dependent enzyme [Solirubrobacteraceae bacterium]